MIKPTKHTAVVNDKGEFQHFGIHAITASMYGYDENDIVEVELTIAKDQSIPPPPQSDKNVMVADYWGWWKNEDKCFTTIYGKHFLLEMCFPYGIEAEEKAGRGKAYRLNVKKICITKKY